MSSQQTTHDAEDRAGLIVAHQPDAIRRRLSAGARHSYLKDFIYGAIDGAVTTFAVVSGVAGAGLPSELVLVLGSANLLADGFSMAASNYLGTRAEYQQHERVRNMEERHIDVFPEGEREEIRQIFAAHGFQGADLERVVKVITADRRRWVDTMLKEEHGLPLELPSAVNAALTTFAAFLLIGSLPMIPFLLNLLFGEWIGRPYLWSTLLTGAAFFTVGAIKSRFVEENWLSAGLKTVGVGGFAAGLAYVCGRLLAGLAA